MKLLITLGAVLAASVLLCPANERIRPDHPRLFFNAETWPAIRQQALGPARPQFNSLNARVEALLQQQRAGKLAPRRDYGVEAAAAAFVYRVNREEACLNLARQLIERSLLHYEHRYEQRQSVDWLIHSRVHLALAWDWLYNDLPPAERSNAMSRLIRVIDGVSRAAPPIPRENRSHFRAGMYGYLAAYWPIALTAHGTGIEEAIVSDWLRIGREENSRMLDYRAACAGDDGGGATSTLFPQQA